MKKIALLHYSYPPSMGGVEGLMQEQAHILADFGYDVMVLTGSGNESDDRITLVVEEKLRSVLQQNPSLQEKIVTEGIMDEEFSTLARQIYQMLDTTLADRDVIIVHNMTTLVHNLPFLFAFKEYVSLHPEKKVLLWVHDQTYINEEEIQYEKEGVALSAKEKELLLTPIPNATYIVISETFGKLFSEVMDIPKEHLHVIPNGINMQKFFGFEQPLWNIMQSKRVFNAFPLLFSPVNILQRKNLLYTIEIIGELRRYYPNIAYVVTGKPSIHRSIHDYYDQLHKKIHALDLENHVLFLGELLPGGVSSNAVRDLYTFSDAVLYFSKSENFGLPILEATLLKTPIFVSDLKVFHEIGKEYLDYIDTETVTPSSAAKLIQTFLEKDTLAAFQKEVKQKYSLETIVKEKLLPLF